MYQTSRKQLAGDIDHDLEWCHEIAKDVSRTFAITIDVLDEPMSSYICLGYLICRIADTIEDAQHISPSEKVVLLHEYDRVLDPTDETTADAFRSTVDSSIPSHNDLPPDWRLVTETPRVFRQFENQPTWVNRSIRSPARELVQGMAFFVDRYADTGGLRIQTVSELEEYCHYAAGTVGSLITNLVCRSDVVGEQHHILYTTARSFGLLLQLVNIAKDVCEDFRTENNVYIPASWLQEEGLTQDDICDEMNEDEAAAVVRRTANHARTFIDDAQKYLEHVPETNGNRLAAWSIPFVLAMGTLRELTNRPEDALSEHGVKISRQEVAAVVAELIGESDHTAVNEIGRVIAHQPFHTRDF